MLLKVSVAFLATFCFGFLSNIKKEHLLYAAIGGGISSFIFETLLFFGVDTYSSTFLAAFLFATYAEFLARFAKTTTTTFTLTGLLPLAPGQNMYLSMLAFVKNNTALGLSKAISALTSALLLALGIMVVATLSRYLKMPKPLKKK